MANITMLTEMLSKDLDQAVAGLKELGIRYLDLKGGVFGRSIEDLDSALNDRLADTVRRAGMEVWCFSSVLGHVGVDKVSEMDFRKGMTAGVDRLLATAACAQPAMIRLLACRFDARADWADSNRFLEAHAPWVYAAFRDAVERIHAAGIAVTIENEPRSAFSTPQEIAGFYDRLGCAGKVWYTWDVQNMWQSGVYPTLDVYSELRPLINYVHLKGGASRPDAPRVMSHRSLLEDAGWPVREIVAKVLADGVSPVLCLNTSHGSMPEGYALAHLKQGGGMAAEEARLDAAFLRRTFREIA